MCCERKGANAIMAVGGIGLSAAAIVRFFDILKMRVHFLLHRENVQAFVVGDVEQRLQRRVRNNVLLVALVVEVLVTNVLVQVLGHLRPCELRAFRYVHKRAQRRGHRERLREPCTGFLTVYLVGLFLLFELREPFLHFAIAPFQS